MNDLLHHKDNAAELLKLTADTLLLIDAEGICQDISVNFIDLWFMKEKELLGKNIFHLMPNSTSQQIYADFLRVLNRHERTANNYRLDLRGETYYFKCIMTPYKGMVLCQYRDITERSLRRAELEKKNHELGEIQRAALIGNFRYESQEECFYYYGHTGVMCLAEEQSITLQEYLSRIVEEDRASFLDWLTQNLRGDLTRCIDYRMHFNDTIHYIRLKVFSRERHPDGQLYIEGYIQNITDIQQSRNDINLLTHAINNSIEDIFATRLDGSLVFCNRLFRQHHGINEHADIATLNMADLSPQPDTLAAWETILSKVNEGGGRANFSIVNPLPDSPDVLAYEGTAFLVTSDRGEVTLWAFGRDVSQRLKLQRDTKRLNLILDTVIENLPAGIVVKDILNDFRYIYRNRESYNRDLQVDNPIGKNDFDCHPHELALKKRKQDEEAARTGRILHWQEEDVDHDGNTIYLDKRKIKIESPDFSPILLNIDWDITETEKMKREIIRSKEKAEASDKLKSAFLANMSHEIRTPLNAIVGFSRIIAESNDPQERSSYYSIVEANNERLLFLINEILDLSKIEAGMSLFNIQPVHLYPLCREVYNAHKLRCPGGVKLVLEPSDDELVIKADKNRLFQVISNLIGNAFKFTTTGSVSFGYQAIADHRVEFHVSDTGAGIAPEKLGSVFDRFVKANEFVQGTGLGLSISKTIVERLGGEISVSSTVGKGTTFHFVLPIGDLDEEELAQANTAEQPQEQAAESCNCQQKQPESAPLSPNGHKYTILYAEDMDSNWILAKAVLGKLYHMERAKDGIEAVQLYEELHPDLILMDMKMPNMGGLDATRIIRELSPNVPIIALTAFAFDDDCQRAHDAGCNDFLTKPYTQEAIKKMIAKHLCLT